MKLVSDLIERHPLVHAEMSDSVRDVARRMAHHAVGAVAVLDSGRLVGIFSERDIVTRIVAEGRDPQDTPVGVVMTKNLIVASPNDDVKDAVEKMVAGNFRHLPVVADGSLVAMISIRDLLEVDDETNRQRASFLSDLVTYSPDYDS